MKIIIVTPEFSTEGGGLSYSCKRFYTMLLDLGHDVKVVCSAIDSGLVINSNYNATLGHSIAYETKFKEDVQHIDHNTLLIAFGSGFNGYYTALLSKKRNCKYWLMLRGSDINLSKWNPENTHYNKYAIEFASNVIALSKELCENARLLHPNINKICIIPNWGERQFVEIKQYSSGIIRAGVGASHLNEKKGVASLLYMLQEFCKRYDDISIQLEFVGVIDEEVIFQYNNLCQTLGITHNVRFMGYKTREEFRVIQGSWDIYVQASVCEGMGNSVVDCMSAGVPVMLSNTGYVAEFATEHFGDMVFSSTSASSMAEALYAMLKHTNYKYDYKRFYNLFFKEISRERVEHQWKDMFAKEVNTAVSIAPLNSILSLSLHDVDGETHDNITTPINVFRNFVENVLRAGYGLCSLEQYVLKPPAERQKWIVCTFDDGYKGLLNNVLTVFKKFGFTATVFVCVEYIGENNDWNFKDPKVRRHLNVEELKTLQHNDWEIGSHGLTHRSLLRLTDIEVVEELSVSKQMLEQLFGSIKSYAYPYGDYSEYIKSQVMKFYDYAFLLRQGGIFLEVDSHSIHRYYISEINQIIH